MRKLTFVLWILLLPGLASAAWTYKFVATTGGKDGSSSYTVTAAVADGVWTALSKTLHHDGSFSTALGAATEYLYISSATAGTAGLYTIASITSADEAILGTLVQGAGIVADQTDVVCGTGPWTIEEAVAAVAVSNLVNVKQGDYNLGADLTFSTTPGAATTPIKWRGYYRVIGDLDDGTTYARTATYMPQIHADTATDQILGTGAHQVFSNIIFLSVCTDFNAAVYLTGGNMRFIGCQFINTAAAANSAALRALTTGPYQFIRCYFSANVPTTPATAVVIVSIASALFDHCTFHGGDIGISSITDIMLRNCIIDGFVTTGINQSNALSICTVLNSNIYSATGTNGINIATIPTTGNVVIANTIIGGVHNGVIAASSTNGITLIRDHFYGCTHDVVNVAENSFDSTPVSPIYGLIDDDTDPWAVGSYALAAGNTIDKSTGWPGKFENETYIGYSDIGAVRHVDPAAGGGAPFFIAGFGKFEINPLAAFLCGIGIAGLAIRIKHS